MSATFVMDYDGETVRDVSDTSSKASEVKTEQTWTPESKKNGTTTPPISSSNSTGFYTLVSLVSLGVIFLLFFLSLTIAVCICFTQLNSMERKIAVLNDKIIDLETLTQTNRNNIFAELEDRVAILEEEINKSQQKNLFCSCQLKH